MQKSMKLGILYTILCVALVVPNLAYAETSTAVTTIPFADLLTTQVVESLVLGIVAGFIAAILGKWSSGDKWNGSLFGYTWGIATLSALAIVSKQPLTSDNFLMIIMAIFGGIFVINKGIQAGSRLRVKATGKAVNG